MPSARIRFAAEAAFLILVASGAALAQLSPLTIIFLMLFAWVLVALIERASSRMQGRAPIGGEEPAIEEEPEAPETPAGDEPRPALRWLFWRRPREGVEPLPAPTAPLEERPSRSHVRRLEIEAPPVEIPAEPEPAPTEMPEPPPPSPVVTRRPLELPGLEEPVREPIRAAVPPPARPSPAPPPAEQTAEPAHAALTPAPRPPEQPAYRPPPAPRPPAQEWNLWDLERRAREQSGDAARDEEWTALFLHLREYANADGILPKEFDDLVRESFADLIRAA